MRLVPVLACLAIATACSIDEADPVPQSTVTSTSGALLVDWTVLGASDESACTDAGALAVDITIFDSESRSVGRFQQSCNAFTTSIDLEAGIYAGESRLIGAGGIALTRAVTIDRFTVYGTSQLTAAVDFSSSTFLAQNQ